MDTLFLALRVVVSLAAVLGVIWYVQRRLSRGGRTKQAKKTITVVGRQGVGSKASVAVIDVDGKRFLLGVTEHAVNILHTSEAPAAPAEAFAAALDAEGDAAAISAARSLTPVGSAPLAGSILSAETWRRAFASLRP